MPSQKSGSKHLQPYLLNIETRSNINEHLLPIRQPTLNIQRAGKGHQNLIPSIGTLLCGTGDTVVDRVHAVPELGLGCAQLRV